MNTQMIIAAVPWPARNTPAASLRSEIKGVLRLKKGATRFLCRTNDILTL